MSAYVPFEILVKIIQRVHLVKSLVRFRSVSKRWKSLIDSSEFIADNSVNQTQLHHLLVSYDVDSGYKYVSIVDDDSFPHQKFPPTVPPIVKLVNYVVMFDCSHGLVCLYGFARDLSPRNDTVVLWNPSIGKSVGIVLPHEFNDVVGFGVCPKTCDPKIVTITPSLSIHSVYWKAEVLTLSSGAWRSILVNLPRISLTFGFNQAVIDGVIHWVAGESLTWHSQIVSFDLTSEEFGEVHLPDSLAHSGNISISKLKESLACLDYDDDEDVCNVWMMTKNGDMKYSFSKLFTLSLQVPDGCQIHEVIGFRKDGQPILECEYPSRSNDHSTVTKLEAYEPSTKHSRDLGIKELDPEMQFMMTSYKESLLLLNHSGSIIR